MKSIFADNPDWFTVETGFKAHCGEHTVDGDIYRPREPDPTSEVLVFAASGYTGIKNLYPRLFAQALTQKGFSVFTIEFLGYGLSTGSASNIRLSEQTQAALAAADELRERRSWRDIVALGWGMGAGVLFRAAETRPSAFDGLIGANGLYDSQAVQKQVRGEEGYAVFLEKIRLLRETERQTGETCYVDSFFGYPLDTDTGAVVDSVLRRQTGYHSPPVHLDFVEELLALNAREDLAALADTPALLLHGRDNTAHPIEHVRQLVDEYPDTQRPRLVALDGKHNDFMSFDHPVFHTMIDEIDAWLRERFVDTR